MQNKNVSRRKFMAIAAGTAAAGSVLGFGGIKLASAAGNVKILVNGMAVNSQGAKIEDGTTLVPVRFVSEALGAKVDWDGATNTVSITTGDGTAPAVAPGEPPQLPWTYVELDPAETAKLGYEYYFSHGGCASAAYLAIVSQLKEKVGYPWSTLPDDMWRYGAGGAAGWGTLCGALNSTAMVLGLAAGTKDGNAMINELYEWYSSTELPTKAHEAYCKYPNQITTVPRSPLCHISVSVWSNQAGVSASSPEKLDRCAKVSGDTAAKAVSMLNEYWARGGKLDFIAAWKPKEEFAHCAGCHTLDNATPKTQQGKMNCVTCHDDHTKTK